MLLKQRSRVAPAHLVLFIAFREVHQTLFGASLNATEQEAASHKTLGLGMVLLETGIIQ